MGERKSNEETSLYEYHISEVDRDGAEKAAIRLANEEQIQDPSIHKSYRFSGDAGWVVLVRGSEK